MLAAAKPAQPIWRVLVSGIRAVSPLLAREIVCRATGRVETKVRDLDDAETQFPALLDAFHGLLIHVWEEDWQPHVALEEGEVVAYAPYALTQYAAHGPRGEAVRRSARASTATIRPRAPARPMPWPRAGCRPCWTRRASGRPTGGARCGGSWCPRKSWIACACAAR